MGLRTPEHLEAMERGPFFEAVDAERAYQRQRWGDAHDDDHTAAEWGLILLRHAGEVGETLELSVGFSEWEDDDPYYVHRPIRIAAIKLAACCAALVDVLDRSIARHGDG